MIIVLQIPGAFGGELAIVLFILFLVVPILALVYVLRRLTGPDEGRIHELERRVEELASKRGE